MAMSINVNGGTKLQFGSGQVMEASQQLSTAEVSTDVGQTDVKTYGGATKVSGQAMRTLNINGYQDWKEGDTSVCKFFEDNQGTWVPVVYDQYGGGTASPSNPIVTGEVLCVAPMRGGTVDEPETFQLSLGIQNYSVDTGA